MVCSPPARRLWLAVALLLLAAAPAGAAIPVSGARYAVHDHRTKGDNWHVDATVAKGGRTIKTLVLYSQRCGGHTPFAEGVPIGPVGDVLTHGPADATDPQRGAFLIQARFVTSRRLEGAFRIATRTCDTGAIPFVATTKDDGHAGHDHAGSHHGSGPAFGTMPDLDDAGPRRLRQARRLWLRSRRAARQHFPTYRAARRQGFERYAKKWKRPVVFHLRKRAYETDGVRLDPDRPESLVYYWPRRGKPILIAFMYRAPTARRAPGFGSPLLAWHAHARPDGGLGASQMAHVWLTGGLRSALANCLPVAHLERAIPRFDFADVPTKGAAHESAPCPMARAATR